MEPEVQGPAAETGSVHEKRGKLVDGTGVGPIDRTKNNPKNQDLLDTTPDLWTPVE